MRIAVGRTRTYATALAAALLVPALTASAAGRVQPRYPAPPVLAPVGAATLEATYAANARQIERARRLAERAGDGARARVLAGLARPGRHFLGFDPRGDGQAVEVLGDLVRARTVAVVVPGSDQDLGTFDGRPTRPYDSPGGGARALRAQVRAAGADLAVIAWLGYRPPSTLSLEVAGTEAAERGALALRRLISEVRRINTAGAAAAGGATGAAGVAAAAGAAGAPWGAAPGATPPGPGPAAPLSAASGTRTRVSLLCHSYGSGVCARAVRGRASGAPAGDQVDEVIAYGSPGMGVGSVAEIGTRARIWAARGERDWIAWVPNLRVHGLGHGADPVAPGFGARVFDAGAARHGEYLAPGSPSLRNIAGIVLGRTSGLEVTHG